MKVITTEANGLQKRDFSVLGYCLTVYTKEDTICHEKSWSSEENWENASNQSFITNNWQCFRLLVSTCNTFEASRQSVSYLPLPFHSNDALLNRITKLWRCGVRLWGRDTMRFLFYLLLNSKQTTTIFSDIGSLSHTDTHIFMKCNWVTFMLWREQRILSMLSSYLNC